MAELVGILNLTPNSSTEDESFFVPYYDPQKALAHAEQLFEEGAAIVDVGAESTSPGVMPVDEETEWWRLKSVLPVLMERHPGKVSLDTRHPEIARRALEEGEVIINDVTAMNNLEMVNVVAKYGARCIVSHMYGVDIQAVHNPKTPKIGDINVVVFDLMSKLAMLEDRGLDPGNIILDPGAGFGKTPELNRQLLTISRLLPGKTMIGASHKRFVGSYFAKEDEDRKDLAPNLRAARMAIAAGADYLRVHDVAGHQQLL